MRKRDGMSDTSLVDPGSEKRIDEVADALQKRGGSATSAEVAADLGIHPSTARFHLDRLVEQGRVETTRQHRATRGRPHTVFTLVSDEGPRAYRLLAQMLVDEVASSDDPTATATRIGQRWGRHRPGDLAAVLDEMGFSPAPEEEGIVLRHCPFLDLAVDHPQVVCALHCGVVEGVTGKAATIDANPGVRCVVHSAA
ncbi:type IV toxin-antitoxin system AbiEi family antitoxin domain-containing protein [Cutibacterium avidum]|uniref:helix-turn-helix transcriptional regulator n=1 Tax=Cutibacterium avidum TaxID=33010 RepID=UPI00192BF7FF|nr:helix-turn-helix domain-containing protein [Cutibacterium avidum]QQY15866.1 type IV toxin-antitoxin system AbiEi family antitoxin domain-containing protein [Cutibacterium avidum]